MEDAYRLGEMAHVETGFGIAADKATKNRFSADNIYNFIRPCARSESCGSPRASSSRLSQGVVAAIIPSTNPTSTAIFKILIAIKARNSVVLSPHPSATNCINETARIMREAGEAAGLPPAAVGCMSLATIEGTQELMKHKRTAVILATGGIASFGRPIHRASLHRSRPGNVRQ